MEGPDDDGQNVKSASMRLEKDDRILTIAVPMQTPDEDSHKSASMHLEVDDKMLTIAVPDVSAGRPCRQ